MSKISISSLILVATALCRLGGVLDPHFSQNHPPTPPLVKVTVEGEVNYCFVGGVTGHMKSVGVRIYTMQQSEELRKILDEMKLHPLPADNEASTLQRVADFWARVESATRRARTFLPIVKTDPAGRFRFDNVPAGQSFFLFVITSQEDGTNWVGHLLSDVKPGMEPIRLIFDEEDCKPKAQSHHSRINHPSSSSQREPLVALRYE